MSIACFRAWGLTLLLLAVPAAALAQTALADAERQFDALVKHADPAEAMRQARQWRERASTEQEPLPLIMAEMSLAWLQRRSGDYSAAILSFRQALARSSEQTPASVRGRLLADLGISYALVGLHAEALDHSRQALAVFRQLQDDRRVSATLGNIGNLLGEMEQFVAAREHYQAALELKRSAGIKRGIGGLYNNLADLAVQEGQRSEARDLLLAAVTANREEQNTDSEALSLLNLAAVEADLAEWAQADQHLAAAETLIGKDVLPLQTSAAYVKAKLGLRQALAGSALQPDLLSGARRELLRAADLGKRVDDPKKRRRIAELGVELESAAGDYRRALDWQRQAEQQTAELESAQAKARQAALSAQYLDERRNRELLELRAKDAQRAQERDSQQRKVWLLGGLLSVLAIVAFHLLQRVRWRKLQSADLAAHVAALEQALDHAEQMRQRAEQLSELNKQLLRVVGDEVRRPALQVRRQAERLLVNDLQGAERATGLSTISEAASQLLRTSEQVLENSLGSGEAVTQPVDLLDLLSGLVGADRRAGEPQIDLHIDGQRRPKVAVDGARLQLVLREWLGMAREQHGRDARLSLSVQIAGSSCRLRLDDPGGALARRLEQARARFEGARLGVLWLNQAVQQIGGRFDSDTDGPMLGLALQLPLAAPLSAAQPAAPVLSEVE